MSDSSALATALAREARAGMGEHPDSDRLLDYHAGLLGPDAEAGVQDHLAACRGCMRRFLELEPFAEPDLDPDGTVSDFEVDASLRRLERQIHGQRQEAASRPPRFLYAVAAALAAACLGLTFWIVQLRSTMNQPQPNVAVVYVDDALRVRDPAASTFELQSGQDQFLVFVTPSDSTFPEYEIRFLTPDGQAAFVQRGLERLEGGTVRLLLARRHLPAGTYRFELHGLAGEERTLVESIDRLTFRYR